MSAFNVTDCLVLKIVENDSIKDRVDNTIYILYDTREQTYVIRGQRECGTVRSGCTFSYICENEDDLADYLQYVICHQNTVNEILYNYDNLPDNSNDITFEFFQKYDHSDYEVGGYDDRKLSRKRLLKTLRMLRNVFNYYN
jgi:hypothetical protein